MANKKSNSQARKISGYPPGFIFRQFRGYIKTNEISASTGLTMILRDFFSRLPSEERKRYLGVSSDADKGGPL